MKMLLVLVLGSVLLFYIDRQGFVFVTALGLVISPFMFSYWYCVFRWGGKPVETDEDIYQQELQKRGTK